MGGYLLFAIGLINLRYLMARQQFFFALKMGYLLIQRFVRIKAAQFLIKAQIRLCTALAMAPNLIHSEMDKRLQDQLVIH